MTKVRQYRIKKIRGFFYVERKGFFGWHYAIWERDDWGNNMFPYSFPYYQGAKNALENLVAADEAAAKQKAEKPKYYYPPLPENEPE